MPAPLQRFSGMKGKILSTAVAVFRDERVKHCKGMLSSLQSFKVKEHTPNVTKTALITVQLESA